MATHRLKIKEINRGHPIWVVKPTDFVCESDEEIQPAEVLRDPKFSVYCLDRENDAVLFVESGDPLAVDRAAFYYQAQVEHAIGLVSMPTDVFHSVAAQIPMPPKGVIFVHSVGRCGSTLLSKALEAVPSVHSLSEPDDLTQMVGFRTSDGSAEDWLPEMIRSSVKWRCKPRLGPAADHVAIKMRSEVLVLADLIGDVFNRSKHFFLYRDAVTWMGSVFRGWNADRDVYDQDLNRKMSKGWSDTLPILREYLEVEPPLNAIQIRLMAWMTCMEGYLKLTEKDIPLCAATFKDLTAHPKSILEQFFAFCEISDVDWSAMEEVLGRDSQAGTIYDREKRKDGRVLTPELTQDIYEIVATRPVLRTPDVVLPRTLKRLSLILDEPEE